MIFCRTCYPSAMLQHVEFILHLEIQFTFQQRVYIAAFTAAARQAQYISASVSCLVANAESLSPVNGIGISVVSSANNATGAAVSIGNVDASATPSGPNQQAASPRLVTKPKQALTLELGLA